MWKNKKFNLSEVIRTHNSLEEIFSNISFSVLSHYVMTEDDIMAPKDKTHSGEEKHFYDM